MRIPHTATGESQCSSEDPVQPKIKDKKEWRLVQTGQDQSIWPPTPALSLLSYTLRPSRWLTFTDNQKLFNQRDVLPRKAAMLCPLAIRRQWRLPPDQNVFPIARKGWYSPVWCWLRPWQKQWPYWAGTCSHHPVQGAKVMGYRLGMLTPPSPPCAIW